MEHKEHEEGGRGYGEGENRVGMGNMGNISKM